MPTELSLDEFAKMIQIPLDFLEENNVSLAEVDKKKIIKFSYLDLNGEPRLGYYRFFHDFQNDIQESFDDLEMSQLGSNARHPYGLWKLRDFVHKDGRIYIVDSEIDALVMWASGYNAIAVPGYDNWDPAWTNYLEGIDEIRFVLPEDKVDSELSKTIFAEMPMRSKCSLILLGDRKSLWSIYTHDKASFNAKLKCFDKSRKHITQFAELLVASEFSSTSKDFVRFVNNKDLLGIMYRDLHKWGTAGEEDLTKLMFLTMISRLSRNPLNLYVSGVSGSGKTFITQRVLELFPESAYFHVTSENFKEVLHDISELNNRIAILDEQSMSEDEFEFVFSILSHKKSHCWGKSNVNDSTGFGIIVLAQSSNRNLSQYLWVRICENSAQTKRVFNTVSQSHDRPANVLRWIELQKWLESERFKVKIPFLPDILNGINDMSTHMRRTIHLMITLIESHAWLHKSNRERDDYGNVIADMMKDYKRVWRLSVDSFDPIPEEHRHDEIDHEVARYYEMNKASQLYTFPYFWDETKRKKKQTRENNKPSVETDKTVDDYAKVPRPEKLRSMFLNEETGAGDYYEDQKKAKAKLQRSKRRAERSKRKSKSDSPS